MMIDVEQHRPRLAVLYPALAAVLFGVAVVLLLITAQTLAPAIGHPGQYLNEMGADGLYAVGMTCALIYAALMLGCVCVAMARRQPNDTAQRRRVPWWAWPAVPIAFVAVLVFVLLPLGVLGALSIPYYAVYPDRHAQLYDFKGTPRQRELLARWRQAYRELGFSGRIGRAWKLQRRRARLKSCRDPV